MTVEPRLRRVEAQTVLAVRRRISIDELDDHIETSMRLLESLAPVAAPHFVVYWDGLAAGKDGTVEVCQPVDERAPAISTCRPGWCAASRRPTARPTSSSPAPSSHTRRSTTSTTSWTPPAGLAAGSAGEPSGAVLGELGFSGDGRSGLRRLLPDRRP
ncbi:hypothetical protein [Acidipropionibacterium acidipropionici]|uniref:hypothetical protein n=1 Tax=Acidipropionibacterium acidipropionici TaxID=1748 RepID=UPI001F2D9ED0|nr:hypothetical protein [Acidipropionibacterium acidipropionici]